MQRRADRDALKSAIDKVLQRPPLSAARVGVQVMSLDSGEIVSSYHADDLLNPASNVKLFTAAAALARLGPNFRFETEFYTGGPGDSGRRKTLFVRGKGDPSITTERLYAIVCELVHAGVVDVSDIVIDESWFDLDRAPPGWDQTSADLDRSYVAPPGAVSLNWNVATVYVRASDRPGERPVAAVEPTSDYFILKTNLSTSKRRRRLSVDSESAGDKQRITVEGSVGAGAGSWSVSKKIDNPPMYFGQTLKALLVQRGVKVRGKVKLGPVPPQAKLLYVAQSESLDLILKKLNKFSSNFIAEQLIKALAAEAHGPPGTTAGGIEVVEEFLAREVRIPRGSYVMKNGSGLNDTNRFSAAQINRLLAFMSQQFPAAPEYLSSLGIAGMDGTIRYRFEGSDAVGRLRAKTGTLENVSALSGYVVAVGGEHFAFSMMVNDYPGRAGPVIKSLDAIGAAVAAFGSREGPSRAVAAMLAEDTRPGSLEELRTRVKTYLALGKQADRRNIPFLRTAWRTEKDPAVRAVVADSLYQSDPQDDLGARTLLESFAATAEVYGRLRQVARELDVEVPGFSSVVDLAAEGRVDALVRLLELCRASEGDSAAQADLAEALSDVSRTAPQELLMALKSASPADLEASTLLLARGLAAAGEPEHALWGALKRSMASVDGELAAFARNIEVTLSKQIADEKARTASAPDPAASGGSGAAAPKPPTVARDRPGG
ncbi:MAG TPA: D-alanyl-D-alanine carboxypeptidase/D-alanyl-D-alanine-endopeptidase [Myxococcaceae bacterium]|nr:D-alanyl-D-alanine carboxypeptidase/D-alanyl-D-alanine-endopeptidase [Myxococcaceae bacterium]